MPRNTLSPPPAVPRRWLIVAEIGLILAVFTLQGAWPVPDVNEPYYLGKAIDYWNPDWIANDPFLESADTHTVFYFTFGWLSLLFSPPALAWIGRLATWTLLAWAWRRLSFAVWPRPWGAALTGAIFVCLLQRCQMAGEWVIGGVEAKGFAYVLVLLGLEALVRGRWNRTWLLFGAASAFHVLVGGWSVVAAAAAWLLLWDDRPPLRAMWPGLLGGLLLSLPGLVPSLTLTWGMDPEVVARANQIYVFQRLGHHLNPAAFPGVFVARFLVMTLVWAAVCCGGWLASPDKRIRAFVLGTLMIAAAGTIIAWSLSASPAAAAGLLRFYWFRMSDVALPLGLALAGPRLFEHLLAATWLGSSVTSPQFSDATGGSLGSTPATHAVELSSRTEPSESPTAGEHEKHACGVQRWWWMLPLAVVLCGATSAGLLFRYGRFSTWDDRLSTWDIMLRTALAIGAALILVWAGRMFF